MLDLPEDRFLGPDPHQKEIALELYQSVAHLPIVSPHGHVDPRLFADPDYTFGTPVDLFIIPDHYVFRMLYSQGIPVETDYRAVWQIFAENFSLFRGTPSGMWITGELYAIYGVRRKLNGATAQVTN